MAMRRIYWVALALVLAFFASCKSDSPTPEQPVIPPQIDQQITGVFVLNEGNFTVANSSLSYYYIEEDTVVNNLFYKANNAPIGDVGQSLAMLNGKLYIVVNGSKYIYKVDATTIAYEAQLTDFYYPREMHIVAPDKAYVSDLMGPGLWIIDPQEMTHKGFVETGKCTERIVQVGNELYVSNWSYYYVDAESHESYNTVQVVDINNDVKVADVTVGKEPNTMVVDKNGHVWVLCEGRSWDEETDENGAPYGENPTLWEIDPQLKTAVCRYEFKGPYEDDDEILGTATALKANPAGDKFYMIYNNEVRRFDIATMNLADGFRITPEAQGLFYNLAVEPTTGDVYVTDAKNYTMNGTVYRYSDDGVLLRSFVAGINPSAMLFK